MKILVTGVNGQLGYDVCKVLQERGIEHLGVDIADFDITDATSTSRYINEYAPTAVIHCAAYTAVDRAEDDVERCTAINVDGTRNIARVCKALGAKMMYISTDYVFPGTGDRPYEVDDETGPQSVYGKTKLAGELVVRELLDLFFIVRISWVFGKNGNNFVKTMLRVSKEREEVSVVCDQIGSPTYTADLAPLLCDMVVTDKYGVYHATNEGYCSWAELAKETFRIAVRSVEVKEVLSVDYPNKIQRPLNSRLSKDILDAKNIDRLPHWTDAVKRYLMELE